MQETKIDTAIHKLKLSEITFQNDLNQNQGYINCPKDLTKDQIGYVNLKKFEQSLGKQGWRSQYGIEFVRNIANFAEKLSVKKGVIWVEAPRPAIKYFCQIQVTTLNDILRHSDILIFEGNCNLILSAPHGGKNMLHQTFSSKAERLQFKEFSYYQSKIIIVQYREAKKERITKQVENCKNKQCVVFQKDQGVAELSLYISKEFQFHIPHIIICCICRCLVDMNRQKCYPNCCCNFIAKAEITYQKYHSYLKKIIQSIDKNYKLIQPSGLLIDVHGCGSNYQTSMIGYAVKQELLNNEDHMKEKSSIGKLVSTQGLDIIQGDDSLGSLLYENGIWATPSKAYSFENSPDFGGRFIKEKNEVVPLDYYNGGFITRFYGSQLFGIVAIQIETAKKYRMNSNLLKESGQKIGSALLKFYIKFFDKQIK